VNGSTGIRKYDEDELAKILLMVPPRARASFSCACAERLMPVYQWFCLVTGSGNYPLVREALNIAWTASAPEQTAELGLMRKRVMGTAPDSEDPRMFPGVAVAQNAVAGVCYALEVCLTGDVQASVWAARQLYEAADAVVQQSAAAQTYVTDLDREQPVRMMLEGIAAALRDASSADAADLRVKAEEDGREFLAILTGQV
jgi:uncharacterized protein YjaG (DUF416 family)